MFILEFSKEDVKVMQFRTTIPDLFLIIDSEKDSHCFQCSRLCTDISKISFVEKINGVFICERCIYNRIKWLETTRRDRVGH